MYKLESAGKNLFQNNSRQFVRITYKGLTDANGDLVGCAIVGTALVDMEKLGIDLSESTILQGGLTIDRYCASGSMIELGTAIAAELTMSIKNTNGDLDNINFEGAELYVEIGTCDWTTDDSAVYWVPMGYFIVDTPPRHLSTISITALDRMVLFDRDVSQNDLSFPMTIEQLILKCCDICGVVPDTSNLSNLPNASYSIKDFPETESLTYRQLIQWCAALTGTCAYMNRYGQLTFQWFEMPTDTDDIFTVSPSNRYSSDIYENDITITGFTFTETDEEGNETSHIIGDDSYAFDLTGNALLQNNIDTALAVLQDAIGGFSYRPHEAVLLPTPWLEPLDMVQFEDKNGNLHDTIVTNTTFTMNSSTAISGVGETSQYNSYASGSGLTQAQANILEKIKAAVNSKIENRSTAILALNETIANSMGLRRIEFTENGSTTYYFCDAATLEESHVIYTFNAGGFAWTNDWNNGNPVWQNGFTKDGNAVLNMLNTYKITSDYIEAGSITAECLNVNVVSDITDQVKVSFKTTLDSIESTVSQLDTILSTAGANLLSNTRAFDNVSGESELTGEYYDDLAIRYLDTADIASGWTRFVDLAAVSIAGKGSFTFSFYARGTPTADKLRVGFATGGYVLSTVTSQGATGTDANGMIYFTLTDDWERYWVTWTLDTDEELETGAVVVYLSYGAEAYMCGCKLEDGNTATPWIAAVADGENAIALLESKITQTASQIRLEASSIVWESDYSSMSEDGTLSCVNANLTGEFRTTGAAIGESNQHITVSGNSIGLYSAEDETVENLNFSLSQSGYGSAWMTFFGGSHQTMLIDMRGNNNDPYLDLYYGDTEEKTVHIKTGDYSGAIQLYDKSTGNEAVRIAENANGYGYIQLFDTNTKGSAVALLYGGGDEFLYMHKFGWLEFGQLDEVSGAVTTVSGLSDAALQNTINTNATTLNSLKTAVNYLIRSFSAQKVWADAQ